MQSRIFVTLLIAFMVAAGQSVLAQNQQLQSQPLNASVSNFGTSFTFSAPPICSGCIEGEAGFISVSDERFVPFALTVAPFHSSTDFSVLANAMESDVLDGRRATHSANRFDFVIRRKIFERNGLVLSVAPRGALFARDGGGRVGGAFAAQYAKGKNAIIANFLFTKAVGISEANPRNDVQGMFDYSRTLRSNGLAVFAGFMHEAATGSANSVSTEQGITIPFRDGQVEFAVEQLNLNTKTTWQFQARITKNWGKIFGKK